MATFNKAEPGCLVQLHSPVVNLQVTNIIVSRLVAVR